ncbi:hypothetical protein PPSIR1_03603 [Plesiocystis pacifica SIR-1]|uniref:Uncharacterized protein n=1 Tax=Plesiocystis pacifica SIR-1 TaxID=391625 RepID=A6G5I0_9BACT|nr:hypothetical protein [Plesiocystis pacifica]EDM78923.1 hypothetical protein PPSIR1_03603 [Plesiocystis pacifica SIR-1]
MGDERRWAARYQFLDELWRGQDRIVYDRELEAVLHAGGPEDGPLAELLGRLLPTGEGEGEDERPGAAWMILGNGRRAASFARVRGGTAFAGLDGAGEVAADERWRVALVHLAGDASPERDAMLEVLAERCEGGERSLALTLPVADGDEDGAYETLADLVEELAGDGRIYGLTRPGLAAFYDFGAVLEAEGDEGRADADESAAEIEVDNSLGAESPRFELFVAVVGPRVPSEGVTYVELPAALGAEPSGARAGGRVRDAARDELGPLKAQLAEVQRQHDLQAIERQKLLDELDGAQDRIASLEEALEVLEAEDFDDGEGKPDSGAEGEGDAELDARRLDVALSREQTLRWELTRARGELENVQSRPVEALEAELASVRAELAEAQGQSQADAAEGDDRDARLAELEAQVEERGRRIHDLEASLARARSVAERALAEDDEGDEDEDELEDEELTLIVETDLISPARRRQIMATRSRIQSLLRKLERGGQLSALELHRELEKLL